MIHVYQEFVPGIPRPKGSKWSPQAGRVIEMSKGLPPWMDAVRTMTNRWHPLDGPLFVSTKFYLERAKSNQTLMPISPVKGDIDKFTRGVYDALKGRAYHDDAQVCWAWSEKSWAIGDQEPGVYIEVSTPEEEPR